MIYGYNTKWDSKSVSGMDDIAKEFIKELEKARRSEEVISSPFSSSRDP